MQEHWKQSTVRVNGGIVINVTRTQTVGKPALLLAHGITDSGLCWHQLAHDLESDYDLVMFDAYGHGQSSRIDPAFRFDMVEDMRELIQALGLEKPGLIGHSMGAANAAALAARYPDLLACLILEDPPWSDGQSAALSAPDLAERKKTTVARQQKTLKQLEEEKKREAPNWEEAILKSWAQAKLDVDPAFFDVYPTERPDWRELAEAITIPTLIIAGDQELGAIVTPDVGVEAIQLLKKGEFGHISSAGHCVRYEQYKPYLNMVKLFLKRNLTI